MKNKIIEIVLNASNELGTDLEINELKNAKLSTKLYGQDGCLDSLGLVRLVSEIEEQISDKLKIDIAIASEKAMSRNNSPFKTIETLSSYIMDVLNSDKNV